MNRQEVNLYTIEFHRSDQLLSVKQILQLTAVSAVILMMFYGFSLWQISSLKEEVGVSKNNYQKIEEKISQINAAKPKSNRAELQRNIDDLKLEISYQENLERIMVGDNLGNADGFSNQLEGLARHSLTDLSLTEIRLLKGGSYLELDGWVTEPSAVPTYLHEIRQEQSFKAVKFGVITIERESDDANVKTRSIRSKNELKFRVGKAEGVSS
ncbi:MAG: hypothetical protein ACRBCS_01520 [Cellvibrionaceae bacterium]